MTTITVHSFKGGTGKSLIAVLLAYEYSKMGMNVLIIDGDYYAPCLSTYFPKKKEGKPFTTYLVGEADIEDTISKTKHKNLFVSYAPSPDFSEAILQADVHTHGQYLKRILLGRDILLKEHGFDCIVFDNSSGVSIPSINQLSCSNKSVIIIRPVRYGIEAVYERLTAIYQKLRYVDSEIPRKDLFVWNQVPTLEDHTIEKRIMDYLNHWKEKFEESWVYHGTTIPYNSKVVSSMVGNQSIDISYLNTLLSDNITEIITALEETSA